jgi:hypothetical protein
VPFLALRLGARAAWLLAGALALSSFVGMSDARLGAGPILRDHEVRVREGERLRRILRTARDVQPPPVVVAGPWEPKLELLTGGARNGSVEYVFALQPAEARTLSAAGREVFFVDGIERWHRQYQGGDLRELGARPLLATLGPP